MKIDARVLLVMARHRRTALLEALEECTTHVLAASNCMEAQSFLRSRLPFQVIVTDTALPDGDWKTVIDAAGACQHAEVVVAIPSTDARRSGEIYRCGADVLFEPFDRDDVRCTIQSAVNARYVRSGAAATLMAAGPAL